MALDLLGRIQQELSITANAIHEAVLAIAERVNRKVQILRLHGQAATLISQIDQVHGELGRQLVTLCASRPPFGHDATVPSDQLERLLIQAGTHIQQLKRTMATVDGHIRELKQETIHHELLTLQQDLSLRAAAIERFRVAQGSPAIGKTLAQIALPAPVRLVTILRGPFLVPPEETFVLRLDDVLVMIGPQSDLALVASWFTQAHKAKSG
ncbi:MAG: TrkA C-terminal domain-containing protein [Nitrospirae bacterium]|nr:TrkA C-terminal domain-containing protein [Nitrospirota bacterium]